MHVDPRAHLRSTALHVENLCVVRGGREILRQVSMNFDRGAVTALVGPSGAGKTTLINVLNGLIAPTAGAISSPELGAIDRPALWGAMRQNTATVFQDHALIGRLSALDNVLLGLADARHPFSLLPWPRAARQKAAQALGDVGLLDRALARVETLSGGEKQRVGIARALARRPKLLLGDEPFASLDLRLARRLGADLRHLALRDGAAIVLGLHQIALARVLADRIIGVNDGRIVFDGPKKTFDEAAEARVFVSNDKITPFRLAQGF